VTRAGAPAADEPSAAEAPQIRLRASPGIWALAAVVAAGSCAVVVERVGAKAAVAEDCFFACVLVVLSVVDLDRHLLPNGILVPAIAILGIAELADSPSGALRRLLWAAIVFVVLLLPALAYPAGLGMGDVKLGFFLGLGLGRTVISALVIGFFAAAIVGLLVVARHGRAGRKAPLPLGPFLALGALATLLAS
jgi:leader peptidase (prepilin peptidase)/N-methyltransferase